MIITTKYGKFEGVKSNGSVVFKGVLYTPTPEQEEEIGQWFVDYSGCKTMEELRALSSQQVPDIE